MARWNTRQLLAYLDRIEPRLDDLDHYRLLDVAPDASPDDIQRAFHQVAGNLHPDLYRQAIAEDDRDRLTTVYGRIAAAYTVLRDPEERARYTRELARAQPAAARATSEAGAARLSPKARRHYRRAQAALRTGDTASAILSLRMALAIDRGSELLREELAHLEGRRGNES